MEKRLFVKMYGEAARTAGELFRMNPVVILAQGAIESGWGESVLAVKYHNFFGIAAQTPSRNGPLLFRRYDTPEHSFMDFARLVSSAYPQAAAVSFYPEAYAQEIAYSRYISEANGDNRAAYCRTLRRIAVDIGLIASFK